MQEERNWEKLLQENLELTRQIKKEVDDIKRHIFWSKVWGFTKLLLIIVPLIIGYIYLIPVFGNVLEQYTDLLDLKQGIQSNGAGEELPTDIINNMLFK